MNFRRGLLFSAGLAGAAYLVKLFFRKDIARYNSLAEMSGDKPLIAEQIDRFKQLIGAGGRNGPH